MVLHEWCHTQNRGVWHPARQHPARRTRRTQRAAGAAPRTQRTSELNLKAVTPAAAQFFAALAQPLGAEAAWWFGLLEGSHRKRAVRALCILVDAVK